MRGGCGRRLLGSGVLIVTSGASPPVPAEPSSITMGGDLPSPPPQAIAAADCVPAACDPLCIDVGRYRVTDQVVEDTATEHRLWERRAAARLSWEDAVTYCHGLTLDGASGWRLPSPVELSAIRYKPGGLFGGGGTRHYCIPSIDQVAFPETPADLFWTSRRMPDDTAWYVGFDDGRSHRTVRTDALWVRCTRDPPPRG